MKSDKGIFIIKYDKTLCYYIFSLFIVTILFFGISRIFANLDENYFKEHEEELKGELKGEIMDGTSYRYYDYDDTPYTKLNKFFILLYLIVPVLFLIVLFGRYILKTKNYVMSLLLPLFFIVLTWLLIASTIYDGIAYFFLMIYIIGIFILISIIGIILFSLQNICKFRRKLFSMLQIKKK